MPLLDSAAGTFENRRVFARPTTDPAGMTGRPWTRGISLDMLLDGLAHRALCPDGRIDAVIELPVKISNLCTFGGNDLGRSISPRHAGIRRMRSWQPAAGGQPAGIWSGRPRPARCQICRLNPSRPTTLLDSICNLTMQYNRSAMPQRTVTIIDAPVLTLLGHHRRGAS